MTKSVSRIFRAMLLDPIDTYTLALDPIWILNNAFDSIY